MKTIDILNPTTMNAIGGTVCVVATQDVYTLLDRFQDRIEEGNNDLLLKEILEIKGKMQQKRREME